MDHDPRPGILCHPGEILKQDFLDPMGMSIDALARALDMPRIFVSEIVQGRRAVTVEIALRLDGFFKGTAESWIRLQRIYDGTAHL